MINKRLIALLGNSKRYIYWNVVCQWLMLLCNVTITCVIGFLLQRLISGSEVSLVPVALALLCVLMRYFLGIKATDMRFLASRDVKKTLRNMLYHKMTLLGVSYHEKVPTGEAVQLASEGVEQLETYYGAFLSQFFYSMLAPITLFLFMALVHLPTALVLLIMVPLIPGAIMAVQKIAKKMLSKYWGQYAKLSDSFLENLQGLTTLKIYQADEYKAEEMAVEAEHFRKITMKVLTMQLNSITIMDIVAYGGAAAGLILSLNAFSQGAVSFWGCFVMIMLAAEFFLPLRALGSYFHTAMNGMAASEKMFRVLDMEEPASRCKTAGDDKSLHIETLSFSYDGERQVLSELSIEIPEGSFVAIVGESGSGKSTIASILTGRSTGYSGKARLGGADISAITESELMRTITYIGHSSYLFKGTVAENLRLGNPDATNQALWDVLNQVRIADFLTAQQGLTTPIEEGASNLSGGQRQRLALARALLHDTPIYIFDEATSNIDAESEAEILSVIHTIAKNKTVVMITHRLLNAAPADKIYVLESGLLVGSDTHETLKNSCPVYAALWDAQQELECYGRDEK